MRNVENLCIQMSTDYRIVEDQVGMVTPRVVSMIINEAYYTVEEGTATKEDINVAMKLGTRYPAGPFEMANSIGITHVYELLKALSGSTGDERYKICSLLKEHYLFTEMNLFHGNRFGQDFLVDPRYSHASPQYDNSKVVKE